MSPRLLWVERIEVRVSQELGDARNAHSTQFELIGKRELEQDGRNRILRRDGEGLMVPLDCGIDFAFEVRDHPETGICRDVECVKADGRFVIGPGGTVFAAQDVMSATVILAEPKMRPSP